MQPTDFCYWLHGWSEINNGLPPTPAQWQIINDHLDLVFNKVTPVRTQSAPTHYINATGHATIPEWAKNRPALSSELIC